MSNLNEALEEQAADLAGLEADLAALPPVTVETDRWQSRDRMLVVQALRQYFSRREDAVVRVVFPLVRKHLHDGGHWIQAYVAAKKHVEVLLVLMTWLDDKDEACNQMTQDLVAELGHCRMLEAQLRNGLSGRLTAEEDERAAQRLRRKMSSRWSPTRPHPDLPAGTHLDRLFGPVVAVVDRVRDTLDPPAVRL